MSRILRIDQAEGVRGIRGFFVRWISWFAITADFMMISRAFSGKSNVLATHRRCPLVVQSSVSLRARASQRYPFRQSLAGGCGSRLNSQVVSQRRHGKGAAELCAGFESLRDGIADEFLHCLFHGTCSECLVNTAPDKELECLL